MIIGLNTRYGKMYVPETDQGQYWWLANTAASPEDEFICVVTALLDERPFGITIDVGANFGCWTLALSPHATTVMAFEPQKCCYDMIMWAVDDNADKYSNIEVYNLALGNCIGEVDVPDLDIETDGNFGGVTLVKGAKEAGVEMIPPVLKTRRTAMTTLDNFLSTSVKPVSFIKIDVEGMELDVLRGAYNTIIRDKPIMMMEMDHKLTDLHKLQQFLFDTGYCFDQYGPNYLCMPL